MCGWEGERAAERGGKRERERDCLLLCVCQFLGMCVCISVCDSSLSKTEGTSLSELHHGGLRVSSFLLSEDRQQVQRSCECAGSQPSGLSVCQCAGVHVSPACLG